MACSTVSYLPGRYVAMTATGERWGSLTLMSARWEDHLAELAGGDIRGKVPSALHVIWIHIHFFLPETIPNICICNNGFFSSKF